MLPLSDRLQDHHTFYTRCQGDLHQSWGALLRGETSVLEDSADLARQLAEYLDEHSVESVKLAEKSGG